MFKFICIVCILYIYIYSILQGFDVPSHETYAYHNHKISLKEQKSSLGLGKSLHV